MRTLSQFLKETSGTLSSMEKITMAEMITLFHERGFGMPLFILALPMALPIPVPPGINIILALPLLILTLQLVLNHRSIWLPNWIGRKEISGTKFSNVLEKTIKWVEKLEKLIKPRLEFMTQGIMSRMVGLAGFIMALSICIPVPLSNTVPSFGIAMMAIGLITRDGFALLFGMCVGLIWVALLSFVVIFLGQEGFDAIKDMIKSIL